MKQWLIFAAKAAISGLLIWWLLERTDLVASFERLDGVELGPLALALLVSVSGGCLLAVRWSALNRILDIPLGGITALRFTWIGLFFNQTLPSTIGGDVARVWFVYRSGVPMERAITSIALDRLCAAMALLVIVALLLPASSAIIADPTPRWSLPVIVVFGVVGFVVLYFVGGLREFVLDRWAATRFLMVLARDYRRLIHAKYRLMRVIVPAMAIHITSVLAVWLIGHAIAADISLLHCLVFVPPVILISLVPISVAGWGVREGAMVVAFGFVGVPEASALIVSLILGLTLVVVGAPGGLLWLLESPATRRAIEMTASKKDRESGRHEAD